MMTIAHEGTGATREAAVEQAHMQAPPSGRDFAVSKAVRWGIQFDGFIPEKLFYTVVEEEPEAFFRTLPTDHEA